MVLLEGAENFHSQKNGNLLLGAVQLHRLKGRPVNLCGFSLSLFVVLSHILLI